MGFVNQTERRAVFQETTEDLNPPETPFSQAFGASVGLFADESLSISSFFNKQAWENRRELITKKIDEGVISRSKYQDPFGFFDWNRAAIDLNDPAIKTTEGLQKERREMLARRRAFAEDEIARGSGIAQFAGIATIAMLDPISIATMPIAFPVTTGKALSILGRSLLTARNAAAIGAATELAIQPFVFSHKNDIESPYGYKDALEAIAGAAIGSAVLGGVAGGVSGYLKKVRAKVEENGVPSDDVDFAMETLARMEETLSSNPRKVDVELEKRKILIDIKAELLGEAQPKLSVGDVKALKRERQELETSLNKVEDEVPVVKQERGKPARQAKKEAIEEARVKTEQERLVFTDRIDIINQRLDVSEAGARAASDLSRVEAGIIPDRFKTRFDRVIQEEAVRSDIEFLKELEVQRNISGRPTASVEDFVEAPRPKAPRGSVTEREAAILEDNGWADDFNHDIQRYNQVENPTIIRDGEVVDATLVMKEFNDELEGIESVLTCANGKL